MTLQMTGAVRRAVLIVVALAAAAVTLIVALPAASFASTGLDAMPLS
jgi:hypothetical protein